MRLGKPMLDVTLLASGMNGRPLHIAVGFERFFGRSANWMPLSESTVWIL
jgi:hypothetical protein